MEKVAVYYYFARSTVPYYKSFTTATTTTTTAFNTTTINTAAIITPSNTNNICSFLPITTNPGLQSLTSGNYLCFSSLVYRHDVEKNHVEMTVVQRCLDSLQVRLSTEPYPVALGHVVLTRATL